MDKMKEIVAYCAANIEDIAEANVKMREFKAEAIKQGYIMA